MTPTPEVQQRLRRYLLGQLADDARGEIEKELLASDDVYQELLIVEDELVDEYLGGKLGSDERVAFEQHFLATPERHGQLNFARALNRYVSRSGKREATPGFLPAFITRQSFGIRAASIVVLLTLLGGAIWLSRNPGSPPQTFAILSLTSSRGTRAEGPQVPTVKLPIAEDALKIIMTRPEQHSPGSRVRVELESSSSDSRTLEAVVQDNQSVTVIIPANELKAGHYSIKLFAVNQNGQETRDRGSYLFTLE